MTFLSILAEGAAPAGGAGGGLGMNPIFFILIMFALMYFMIIRPQRNQQKKMEELRKNIGKGDQVVSIGGIHGLVTGMTDRTVSVKVADGISIKFDRSAIASVDHKGSGSDDSAENDETEKG